MTLQGMTGVLAKIHDASKKVKRGGVKGLQLAGRNTLNRSNLTIPWEEGDLSRDGAVSVDEEAMIVAVSYGHDPLNGIKAVVNHEDMSLRHDPGKGPKFLENAVNALVEENGMIIAEQIRREAGLV